MVDIYIHVEKKYLYFLGCLVLLFVGIGVVYSFGGDSSVYMGHSSGEIRFDSNSVNVSAINFDTPNDVFPADVIDGAQKRITGICDEGTYMTGVDSQGGVICGGLTKPLNVDGVLNVKTGAGGGSYYGYSSYGCVDVSIDCENFGLNNCRIFWNKIGSDTSSSNKGVIDVAKGQEVKSSTHAVNYGSSTDHVYSCVVRWDDSSNRVMLYGLDELIPSKGDYTTYQENSYRRKSIEWYIP